MHYYGANSYRNKNIEICTNAIFDVVKENCGGNIEHISYHKLAGF
jgi:hypothetical protein